MGFWDTKQEPPPPSPPLAFRPAAPGESFRSVVHSALCDADQAVKACGTGDTPEALIARAAAQTHFNRLQRLHMMLEHNPTLDGTGF